MKTFMDMFDVVKGYPIVWEGRLGLVQDGYWSPLADYFEIRCVSISNQKEYWTMQFSGHYIGQMKSPQEFFNMVFKQTPPDVLHNKLFRLVFS